MQEHFNARGVVQKAWEKTYKTKETNDAQRRGHYMPEPVRGPFHVDSGAWTGTSLRKEVSQAILDPRMKSAESPDLYLKAPRSEKGMESG